MIKSLLVTLVMSFLATSCSSTISGKWRNCRNTESDLGCVNITKADNVSSAKESSISNNEKNHLISQSSDILTSNINSYDLEDFPNKKLIRVPEKIARLWIAPYSDKEGNYHEAKYIRIKQKDSRWALANKYQ